MTATLQRTPCIGICSTTFGDLVCRGCKRFAHEIVQWNGFADDQRALVWERLYKLRDGAIRRFVLIDDEQALLARARQYRIPQLEALSIASVCYEVLRRSADQVGFDGLGMTPRDPTLTPQALYLAVERELYQRAVAQYERDFHIPAL